MKFLYIYYQIYPIQCITVNGSSFQYPVVCYPDIKHDCFFYIEFVLCNFLSLLIICTVCTPAIQISQVLQNLKLSEIRIQVGSEFGLQVLVLGLSIG